MPSENMPETVRRNGIGAHSSRYSVAVHVDTPMAKPIRNRAISTISTDSARRQNPNRMAPIENSAAPLRSVFFRPILLANVAAKWLPIRAPTTSSETIDAQMIFCSSGRRKMWCRCTNVDVYHPGMC